MKYSKIYLCRADCSILGNVSGIKTDTCTLKKNAVSQWEITFDVERYTSDNSGKLKQSDYYDSIDVMMRLYLDGDDQVYFVIDSEPEVTAQGSQETKRVTAHSIECELSMMSLNNFKINCGTKDSQEYLATDSDGNFFNVNPYTGLPKEYISLVNYDNPQLSVLHLALQGTGWTVAENIDTNICMIKKSFDIANEDIYSFLVNTVSPAASVIFEFDRKHKKISIVNAKDFGDDTGVFITMRNLMTSFKINTSSENDIITKLIPAGNNDIGIEQVNFGENHIINLDYFMDTVNEYGEYKYVSNELHDKYHLWKDYRDVSKVTFNGEQYTRRELYIKLTKLYNQAILDISELKNRVPNDGAVTDYKTFSLEELKLHLNAFNKALVALITLYKNEYNVTEIGEAPNYIPLPSSAVNIKETPYWYDFYAYKESIIPQIEEALKMYCQTDTKGNLVTDNSGNFIELEFGNPAYYNDPSIVKEVDSYKYEWSLYGLDELEAKKKAWSESANMLFNECFIKSATAASPTAYRTPDDNGWNSLSDTQKKEFTSKQAYITKLNQYLDYMSFDARDNSLTKTKCKGIIRQCDDAIKTRTKEISALEQSQNSYGLQRSELANSVILSNFTLGGNRVFTDKDLNIINGIIKEQNYNNPNILITNLDDVVSIVDVQEELYQAAVEELYKLSQPQYSFSTELDNLYTLEEFKSYHKPFDVGNFIRVGFEMHEELFDQNFIKLRLVTIEFNPLEPGQNLNVEFSTMTKELNGISDLAYLFGESSVSSGGTSGSSSSSGGTYGNNDANIQMSNNMIKALLSTELFGTTVTDIILDSIKGNVGNFGTLLSHSGIFDFLETGYIKVSGDCLFDRIKSTNWNGSENNLLSNTIGSIIDLYNGHFSFAGGKLKWDGNSLTLKGTLNGCDGNFTGSINVNNKFFVDDKGNVTANGTLKATDAYIKGNIEATNSVISESVFIDGDIEADTLKVKTSGNIAGWTFDANGFYKNNNVIGQISGAYIGDDGISIGNYFIVNNDGAIIKNQNIKYIYDDHLHIQTKTTTSINNLTIQVTLHNVNINDKIHLQTSCRFCYSKTNGGEYYGSIPILTHFYIDVGDSITIRPVSSGITAEFDKESHTLTLNFQGAVLNTYKPNEINGVAHDDEGNVIYKYHDNTFEGVNAYYYSNYNASEIEKITIMDNNSILEQFDGKVISKSDLMIDTVLNKITGGNFELTTDTFRCYSDYKLCIKSNFDDESDIFILGAHRLHHNGLATSSSGDNLIISNGNFLKKSSSSNRYKNSIEKLSDKVLLSPDLDPEKLYDIDVISFRYNDDYLPSTDQRYQKDIPGFIAEDIYEKYPIACNLDKDGKPEMWDINILFPVALKLIQEQKKEINFLKSQFDLFKKHYIDQTCINTE